MDDLRLGRRVEVLFAVPDPEYPDIKSHHEWRAGEIVGLWWTSVHVKLDFDGSEVAFPAGQRDRTWRVPGRIFVLTPGHTHIVEASPR